MRGSRCTVRWLEIMAGESRAAYRLLEGVGAVEVTASDRERAAAPGPDPVVELLRIGKLADGVPRWTIVALLRDGVSAEKQETG